MVNPENLVQAVMQIIDPRIEHVGVSKLRQLNLRELRRLKGPILIESPGSNPPLAVIIPFSTYMQVQKVMFGVE